VSEDVAGGAVTHGTNADGKATTRLTLTSSHRTWPRVPLEVATHPHPDGRRTVTVDLALDWRVLPRVPLDVAGEPAASGTLIERGPQDEGAPPTFVCYPPAPLSHEEAEALGARLRAGIEAAAMAALDADADAGDVVAAGEAVRAVRAYVLAEMGPPTGTDAAALDVFIWAYLASVALDEARADRDEARAAVKEAQANAPKKRGRPRRGPEVVPQQTWPEFEAVIFGVVVDGRTATQDTGKDAPWQDAPGEVALTHGRKGSALSLRFGASAVDDPQTDYVPLRATSCDELRELLEQLAGPRTAHLFNYAVARGRAAPEGFTVAVDELVNATGPRPRNRREAAERRAEVWAGLRLFGHVAVYGRRKAYAPKKGEPDTLFTRGPLLAFTEVAANEQLSLDGATPPREVTLTAGPWLARLVAENPSALPYFTDDRAAAQLPSGKGEQAWREAIAWALGQRWRVNAEDAKTVRQGKNADGTDKPPKLQTRDFTRRELLDYCPPEPPYADVLASTHPRRAVALWDTAIVLLRQRDKDGNEGVIGAGRGDYVEHGPKPWREPPKGWPKGKPYRPQARQWEDAWLSQKLTIRPGPAGQAVLRDVKAKATAARAKAAAARKKKAAEAKARATKAREQSAE